MASLTEQQQRAVNSIDRNVLVSAGAGSGKTHVLVERYIELLRCNPEMAVSNIVAVTYTRKAAAEMRTRLKSKIAQLQITSDLDERARWNQCYTEIDGARIVTIHSLCESILKAFPVDAAIDPQFEIVDDVGQSQLLRNAMDIAFREVIDDSAEELELLLQQNIEDLRFWMQQCMKSSTQFKEALASIGELTEQKFIAYAQARLQEFQKRSINAALRDKLFKRAFAYVEQNPWRDAANELERLRGIMVQLTQDLIAGGGEHEERWSKFCQIASIKVGRYGPKNGDANEIKAAMKEVQIIVSDVTKKIPADLNDEDFKAFHLIVLFIRLARRAMSHYEAEKRSLLKLDYNDLIELAVSALEREKSPAREHYHQTVRAILVDEFQDTNAMQSRMIKLLASPSTNLFLIGDDKQSIYKFQGADVATFNTWKSEFQSVDADSILSLSQSFRSHPSVVGFINAMFENIMDDSDEVYKARFEALTAARSEADDEQRVKVVVLPEFSSTGEPLKAAELKALEGEAVAGWISRNVINQTQIAIKSGGTRSIQFGDFAVLVQRNQDFADIEIALAAQKIPYVTLGGRGFLERQEIYDVQNLLSFLSYPQDDHALIGILRSPMFGVTDDILHLIASDRSGGRSLWQRLRDIVELRKPGYESIANAKLCLSNWIKDAAVMPVSELLRRIVISTSYDLVLMTMPNGHQRSRNLWKVVHLATENENLSCAEFADSLKLMREFKVKQSDAPLDTGDVVKLMTIHSSKGLEFPAVALPVLGTPATSKATKLKFHRDFGISINTSRDIEDDTKPSWYRLTHLLDTEFELAEKKRLLYVAMTRARDHLALFVQPQAKASQSFLKWIHESLQLESIDYEAATVHTVNSSRHSARFTVECAPAKKPEKPSESGNIVPGENIDYSLIEALPAIQLEAPTSWADWSRVTPSVDVKPFGATVSGTYFHSLMEHVTLVSTGMTAEVIESLAFAQGDVVAHPDSLARLVREGERLLAIFQNSKLATLLKTSKRHFHEMPYLMLDSESSSTKRPDLLIEDEVGNWIIVDYKTDKFQQEKIAQQAAKHHEQLAEYARDLNVLTGIQASTYIYFAEFGILFDSNKRTVI
ncbi:MAG TPA: UvrD-helicase domain-containing protein [Drouetiella sp.]|jgi:ATP-dependent helicase/nuclease subunit A